MGKTLVIDLNNFCHRVLTGAKAIAKRPASAPGGDPFLFVFVRSLRALVAEHEPTSMVLVKEGSPQHRYELFKEYKGNRRVKENDPKLQEKWDDLMALKGKIDDVVNFSLKDLEVTVLRHPRLEADDVIASYARFLATKDEDVVVVSNDGDFAQLLHGELTGRISVWDPGKKAFMPKPEHDPVVFKALVGDKSDNIPGVPGYGPKKAARAATYSSEIGDEQRRSFEDSDTYQRNVKLIEFARMDEDAWYRVDAMRGHWDPAALMIDFHAFGFTSLTQDKVLQTYYDTFGGMTPAKLPMRTQ